MPFVSATCASETVRMRWPHVERHAQLRDATRRVFGGSAEQTRVWLRMIWALTNCILLRSSFVLLLVISADVRDGESSYIQ